MPIKVGVCLPNYGIATSKKAIDTVAELAEDLNYDSVWATDHSLVPEANASPYGNVLEPLTTLSYLASKTKNLELGTSIIIFPLREVVLFAKQAAALQVYSDNRLILGLGAGWNEMEFKSMRADFRSRGQYYDEGVQLFKWLMRGNAEFKGDFYSITDGVFSPVPEKEIPLYMGGSSGASLRRAAKLGDGWFPVGLSPQEVAQRRKRLASLTDRKLKTLLRMSVKFSAETQAKDSRGQPSTRLGGSSSQMISQVKEYESAGVDRLACYFGDTSLEELETAIAKFGKEVMPSL